ncbi:F-box protein SKIP19-like [Lolium rigidum]|uniref:F-box protein SKIP19-like n=1 Tax=Lolium rigidum TaxID=89674 RepID=UPI001F5C32A6|nr:F-box protein SKIP19-like [Lolium rigidum]
MDAAPSPVTEEPPSRDWSLLPLDALSLVFVRLGALEVLRGAGLVCRSWLDAAKVPDVWRVVDMENHKMMLTKNSDALQATAKVAVDRSSGQLQLFAGSQFVTEELMQYIVERSPLLSTLRLVSCRKVLGERLSAVIRESPLSKLSSLELDFVDLTMGELTVVLENCPILEVLTVRDCWKMDEKDEQVLRAKFSRIKTLTFEDYEDFDWYDYEFMKCLSNLFCDTYRYIYVCDASMLLSMLC